MFRLQTLYSIILRWNFRDKPNKAQTWGVDFSTLGVNSAGSSCLVQEDRVVKW